MFAESQESSLVKPTSDDESDDGAVCIEDDEPSVQSIADQINMRKTTTNPSFNQKNLPVTKKKTKRFQSSQERPPWRMGKPKPTYGKKQLRESYNTQVLRAFTNKQDRPLVSREGSSARDPQFSTRDVPMTKTQSHSNFGLKKTVS